MEDTNTLVAWLDELAKDYGVQYARLIKANQQIAELSYKLLETDTERKALRQRVELMDSQMKDLQDQLRGKKLPRAVKDKV